MDAEVARIKEGLATNLNNFEETTRLICQRGGIKI